MKNILANAKCQVVVHTWHHVTGTQVPREWNTGHVTGTQVPRDWNTSQVTGTQVPREWNTRSHDWNTSATRMEHKSHAIETQIPHDFNTNNTRLEHKCHAIRTQIPYYWNTSVTLSEHKYHAIGTHQQEHPMFGVKSGTDFHSITRTHTPILTILYGCHIVGICSLTFGVQQIVYGNERICLSIITHSMINSINSEFGTHYV